MPAEVETGGAIKRSRAVATGGALPTGIEATRAAVRSRAGFCSRPLPALLCSIVSDSLLADELEAERGLATTAAGGLALDSRAGLLL